MGRRGTGVRTGGVGLSTFTSVCREKEGERLMRMIIYCWAAMAAGTAGFAAESARPSRSTGERLACMECHTRLTNDFRTTGHGKAMEFGVGGRELDCGTCHGGDPAKHVLTGKPAFITNQGKEK